MRTELPQNKKTVGLIIGTLCLLCTVIIYGCRNGELGKPNDPQKYETYKLDSAVHINTEYDNYYFTPNEYGRNIYVCGDANSDTYNDYYLWIYEGNSYRHTDLTLKGMNNVWYDKDSHRYTNYFICSPPIGATVGNVYNQIFYIGYSSYDSIGNQIYTQTGQVSTNFQIIENRNYDVEYSYMDPFNLIEKVPFFLDTLHSSFLSAGTQINEETYSTIIPETTFTWFSIKSTDALLEWGDIYSSGFPHDPNKVVLFSVKDHTIPETSKALGVTAIDWNDNIPPRISYSFVFIRRILDEPGNDSSKKITMARTALHELMHARGKDENFNKLKDYSEDNGENQKNCIMIYRTIPEINRAFKICEGHKQALYNTIFVQP